MAGQQASSGAGTAVFAAAVGLSFAAGATFQAANLLPFSIFFEGAQLDSLPDAVEDAGRPEQPKPSEGDISDKGQAANADGDLVGSLQESLRQCKDELRTTFDKLLAAREEAKGLRSELAHAKSQSVAPRERTRQSEAMHSDQGAGASGRAVQEARSAAAAALERASRAEAALASEQERAAQAEAALASEQERAAQAEAALASEQERAAQAKAALASEQERAAQAEAALASEQERAAQAKAALASEQERASRAEAALASEQERASRAEAALAGEQERASRAEAALVGEQERASRAEAALVGEQERASRAEAALAGSRAGGTEVPPKEGREAELEQQLRASQKAYAELEAMCKQDAETIQKGSAELARLQQVLEASTGSAAAAPQEVRSDADAGRIKAEKKLAKLVKAHETLLALASEAGVDLPDEIAFPTKAAADAAGGITSGQVQAVPAPGQLFASPALPSVLRVAAVAQSPFPKRHGVPRQGSLAPHVRTRIVLHPDFKAGAVSHLHMYSHIWVLFQFHKNTTSVKEAEPLLPHAIGEAAESPGAPRRNPPKATQFPANQSISVPGLQGKKTGVFSCRSPHHPNNIGMSLVQIDRVATKQVYAPWYNASRKNGLVQCVVLDVSGADFVDGTPIYDIKPYVYLSDAPHFDLTECGPPSSAPTSPAPGPSSPQQKRRPADSWVVEGTSHSRAPGWLVQAEGKRLPVTFGGDAAAVLASHCDHNPASLYSGEPDVLKAALEEILSLDIRAVHQGRLSGSTADSSPPQELLFDGLRLLFTVVESDGGLAVKVDSISKA